MKKIKHISLVMIALLMAVTACKKIENQNVSTKVKVTYPTITLKGAPAVTINVGDPYTDAGATLTDDITGAVTDITGDISGIDNTTEGLYFVKFMASNANGFETIVIRPVAVTGISNAWDISGDYERLENGQIVTVTKESRGLFRTNNLGGSSGLFDPAFFILKSDTTMDIPEQFVVEENNYINFTNITLTIDPTDTMYEYKVDYPAVYGTSLRHFSHQ